MMKVTATIEKAEQFRPVLDSGTAELVIADSGFFDPASFTQLCEDAHAAGAKIGLRMPQIFRQQAEDFFCRERGRIAQAGFDLILYRNFEEILFAQEEGLIGDGMPLAALDHTIYLNNTAAIAMAEELLGSLTDRVAYFTLPLEWNLKELGALKGSWERELVVYGRAPMMVTAQCIKKTTEGCDHTPEEFALTDRTQAVLPVKNCCRFCCNTIYNSVPTYLCDLEKEIAAAAPDRVRFEFTTERAGEVSRLLAGEPPRAGAFTRGHGKKSVE